jgi:hypothetical protein
LYFRRPVASSFGFAFFSPPKRPEPIKRYRASVALKAGRFVNQRNNTDPREPPDQDFAPVVNMHLPRLQHARFPPLWHHITNVPILSGRSS